MVQCPALYHQMGHSFFPAPSALAQIPPHQSTLVSLALAFHCPFLSGFSSRSATLMIVVLALCDSRFPDKRQFQFHPRHLL